MNTHVTGKDLLYAYDLQCPLAVRLQLKMLGAEASLS